MKRRIAVLLVILVVLTTAVCAYAGKSVENNNVTTDISTEANATAKKAAENQNVTKGDGLSLGDLIRYVPVTIEVSSDEVTVNGCFVNMNDVSVMDFRDFEMDVYMAGELLISGYFGDINSFTVYPDGLSYQSFTFMGPNNLNEGFYVCDDSCYTMTAFRFSSR